MDNYFLLVSSALIFQLFVIVSIFWIVPKIFKLGLNLKQLIVILAIITLIQVFFGLLTNITPSPVLVVLLLIASVISVLIVWHKLVKMCTDVSAIRSIAAYITASLVSSIISILIILLVISQVQVFTVNGSVMEPTYKDLTKVLVYKNNPSLNNDDIIVYQSGSTTAIGRIKGMPGQEAKPTKGLVVLDNTLQKKESHRLADDQYFVVPDNQSAFPHIVNKDRIVGKVGPTLSSK